MTIYKGIFLSLGLCLSWATVAHAVELNWTGCASSTTTYISDLASDFQKMTGTPVSLRTADSGNGIRDVHTGKSDMGCTTRYSAANDQREADVELVPVAWDALAIIVHKDNPLSNISLDQLQAVFSGKITNWSVLGGTKQIIEIYVYQDDHSAAERSVREIIFPDSETNIKVSRNFSSTGSLEQALMENPNAIAITSISNTRMQDVKIVAVDGVAPSVETLKSGDYGLFRPIYLTYNPNSSKIDFVKDFISYLNSKSARDTMRSNGVVPYTEALSLVMKKVRENEASYPQSVGNL